ncbi:MAG: IMPACT family protein [Bradymonadia bacterium]
MASRYTIERPVTHEIEPIKGSRFIVVIDVALSGADGKALVEQCRARWPDASHHCFAWRAGPGPFDTRCSDDGEPKGTAGMPMLRVLEGRQMVCTAVVVTRWFGGTKLGTGGLARAYGQATAEGLELAGAKPLRTEYELYVQCPYDLMGLVNRICEQHRISPTMMGYTEQVTLKIKVAEADLPALRADIQEATAGRIILPDPSTSSR